MIYPLSWMSTSSFKHTNRIFLTADQLIPVEPTLENYINGWKGFAGIFSVFFRNSGFISFNHCNIRAVLSSVVVVYGFACCRFLKTRKILFTCMLLSMMLPFQIIMIPQYIWFKRLNWIDILTFHRSFILTGILHFMDHAVCSGGIPRELDEAAKIDGCSIYGILSRLSCR